MAMASKSGKMEPNMRETGVSTKHVAMANSGMSMEIFSKVNGKTTKQMGMESIFIKMELNMKENGKTIYSMVKEKKYGQIIQCMKDITMKERNMEKACIFGKTGHVTMVTGMKIELKDTENINGKMVEHI